MKEHIEAIKIEGARGGDVVFLTVPADFPVFAYERYSNMLREQAEHVRSQGGFFPTCIMLPPGMSATVTREHASDDHPADSHPV